MPQSVAIFPELSLAHLRYFGFLTMAEGVASWEAQVSHQDFEPTHRQLVDLRGIEDYERDYATFLELQAEHLALSRDLPVPRMVVIIAPSTVTKEIARLIMRSWDDVPHVVCTSCETLEQAAGILGLPDTATAQLAAA